MILIQNRTPVDSDFLLKDTADQEVSIRPGLVTNFSNFANSAAKWVIQPVTQTKTIGPKSQTSELTDEPHKIPLCCHSAEIPQKKSGANIATISTVYQS